MEIVILLIPLALALVAIAIWVFFWAVRHDQFDDLDSPQWQIIFDDRENEPTEEPATTMPEPSGSESPRNGADQ